MMKIGETLSIAVGAILVLASAYIYDEERALGRGGFTSLTRESHPSLFWFEVLAFAAVGIFLICYHGAKMMGVAKRFTGAVDGVLARIPYRQSIAPGPGAKD